MVMSIMASCANITENEVKLHEYKNLSIEKVGKRNVVVIPKAWELRGKIAIIKEDENWYANFFWSKQSLKKGEEQRRLVFTGPFGETHMALSQIKQAELELNRLAVDGEIYTDFSLNQLLVQQFGFEVPVMSLEYWIFGQINPDKEFQVSQVSESGQLLEIAQHGWKINYSYPSPTSYFPVKVYAQKQDYKIKVFIRKRS